MSWSTPNLDKLPTVRHYSSPSLHSQRGSRHLGSDGGSFSSESGEPHFPLAPPLREHAYDDDEEEQCLRHLDELGLALEKTFKKVESIGKVNGNLLSSVFSFFLSNLSYLISIFFIFCVWVTKSSPTSV